tara:strand:+ start:256 stop:549 length:294 start_codon:yes stop_codon:yes gene_type:complete
MIPYARREVNNYGWTVAVHGEFCTGCNGRTGRCGELTNKVKREEQKVVAALKTELKGLLAVSDSMTPFEAERLRKILKYGDHWYVTKPNTIRQKQYQ